MTNQQFNKLPQEKQNKLTKKKYKKHDAYYFLKNHNYSGFLKDEIGFINIEPIEPRESIWNGTHFEIILHTMNKDINLQYQDKRVKKVTNKHIYSVLNIGCLETTYFKTKTAANKYTKQENGRILKVTL